MKRVINKNGVLLGFLEEYARNFNKRGGKPDYQEYCKLMGYEYNGFIDPRIYRELQGYYPQVFIEGEKFIPLKFKTYKLEKVKKITKKFLNEVVNFKSNSRYGIKKSYVVDIIYESIIDGTRSLPAFENGVSIDGNWIRFSSGSYTERGGSSPNSSVYLHKTRKVILTKRNENSFMGYIIA